MDYETIAVRPVGYVRNENRKPGMGEDPKRMTWKQRTAQRKLQQASESELVLDGVPAEILDGIEEFSHLTIVYWAHLISEENRTDTRVHPLGNPEFPLVGVFATHSPARPNSILISTVRLLERRGNVLRVTGLDALDGSPVLDIKPYSAPGEDQTEVEMPEWMRIAHEVFNSIDVND